MESLNKLMDTQTAISAGIIALLYRKMKADGVDAMVEDITTLSELNSRTNSKEVIDGSPGAYKAMYRAVRTINSLQEALYQAGEDLDAEKLHDTLGEILEEMGKDEQE